MKIEALTKIKGHLKHGKHIFVLSGNINDLFPCGKKSLSMKEYLANEFKDQFKATVYFDVLNGVSYAEPHMAEIYDKASFDPADSELQDNKYEKLNLQINNTTNQIPKIDRGLKQKHYKLLIIILEAHQVFDNAAGKERFYLENWENNPEISSSENVLMLLTQKPNNLPLGCNGGNSVLIQVKRPENKQIEKLLVTKNILSDSRLFSSAELAESIKAAQGLLYRDITSIIEIRLKEPERPFKEIAEEFKHGSQRTVNTDEDLRKRVIGLKDHLLSKIKGQDEAIEKVNKSMVRAVAGIRKRETPLVILSIGPSGTGKSQTPKEICTCLYGSDKSLERYNMSEFMSEHDSYRLIGSPPGYVGSSEVSSLAKAIKNNPRAIFLFDEIEKAHPKLFDLFLGLMGDGFFRDNQNNIVSFKHAKIFMTSNLLNLESLRKRFRPEFIGRITVVEFKSLPTEVCKQILNSELQNLMICYAKTDLSLTLSFTKNAKEYLLEKGFDPRYNARELKKVIEREVEEKIDYQRAMGHIKKNDIIEVDIANNEKELKIIVKHEIKEEQHADNQLLRTNKEISSERSW